MPNHVHVLVSPAEGWPIDRVVRGWKSYTAKAILSELVEPGDEELLLKKQRSVWQRDYWDRFIRDEQHYENVARYIRYNPVKAGLVNSPEKWPWSSAVPKTGDQ